MKKAILVISILLLISVIFAGCTQQQASSPVENSSSEQETIDTDNSAENEEQQVTTGPEADKMALEVAKKLEIYDHSFSNYGILYGSFVDKVSELFYEGEVPVFNEDSHFELTYVAAGQEAKQYTEEQRKAASEANQNKVTIEFSDVFTEEARNWKYVYTKSTIIDPTKEEGKQTSYIYRRYVLTDADGDWKILSLDQFNCEEGTPEEEIKFNKYNNEIVEYTDSLPFL